MPDMAVIDFFTVHTVGFRTLRVFLILSLNRRKVIHFNPTANPTADWTSLQLIQAFPFDSAPRYLIRERDGVYGSDHAISPVIQDHQLDSGPSPEEIHRGWNIW